MPVLSGRTNFDPFLKTWKFFTPKFPMKYSKNGQNFTTPKNTWNVIFETCWTPCKKPHFSVWPRSRKTFFWLTPYFYLIDEWQFYQAESIWIHFRQLREFLRRWTDWLDDHDAALQLDERNQISFINLDSRHAEKER